MIRISDAAQAHFAKLLANQEEGTQIRVFVIPAPQTLSAAYLTAHRMRWKTPTRR